RACPVPPLCGPRQPRSRPGGFRGMLRRAPAAPLVLLAPPAAPADTLRSGSLRVDVANAPFGLTFASDEGPVLSSAPGADPGGPSALAVRTSAGWIHAPTAASTSPNGPHLRLLPPTHVP